MDYLRLYKRFYKIESSALSDSYSLINPEVISVKSYLKDTSTLVETVSTIVQESPGVYYVDLNLDLYSTSNSYDLIWNVRYIVATATKNLKTSFKFYYTDTSETIYIRDIETEVISRPIEIEILN